MEGIRSVMSVEIKQKKRRIFKKYSTEDSSSFVNGILAKVILDNGIN